MLNRIAPLLCLAFSAGILDAKVTVREPVPEFSLTTSEGKSISIADLRGKRVLVFMWASW